MDKKKDRLQPIKKILFAYLALSKIMYWIYYVTEFAGSGFDSVGQMVLTRFITRDVFLIACVVLWLILDKLIKNIYIYFLVCYALILGLVFGHMWIQELYFGIEHGYVFLTMSYLEFFINFTITFIAISIIMGLKDYMKRVKHKTEVTDLSQDILRDNNNAVICKDELRAKLNLFCQYSGDWEFQGKEIGEQATEKNNAISEELTQWVFSDITDNSFSWQKQISKDGGVTWDIVFELEARRK